MLLFLMPSTLTTNGQVPYEEPKSRIYGVYSDLSTYTELILIDDKTFVYTDRFELGSTIKYTGKWKEKGKYIILYDCENNDVRPMPVKWKINGKQLCGNDLNKIEHCLTRGE